MSEPSETPELPTYPSFVVGDDPPAPLATASFTLNHLCLLTHDLSRMTHFYRDILGLRTLFTYRATPHFAFAYFGYPHGAPSASDGDDAHSGAYTHQSGAEMMTTKGRREGLLEIIEAKWHSGDGEGEGEFEPSTRRPNTFSHVGMNVPDVRAAEAYLRAVGVAIVKGVGEEFAIEEGGALTNAFGLAGDLGRARAALRSAGALGLGEVLMVVDPDGNLVEVQQFSS